MALPLNIDLVVIPSLKNRGIHVLFWTFKLPDIFPEFSTIEIFTIASVLSAAFTIYFYWFLGWFFREYSKEILDKLKEKEPIMEGLQLWEKVRKRFKNEIERYYASLHQWLISDDNRIVKRLKRGGYPAIFVISMIPEPGTRTAATIFARSLGTKTALLMVIAGETVKNIWVLGLWSLIFWLF